MAPVTITKEDYPAFGETEMIVSIPGDFYREWIETGNLLQEVEVMERAADYFGLEA